MLYGCGLRVTEPLNLRINDLDLERRRLSIRAAKGANDPRVVWQRDKEDRTPVMLPHRLATKYPHDQFSWGWAWLFRAHNICRAPRSGALVRYRMHEANVQRAVKAGLASALNVYQS
jgi:integrase